MNSSSYLLETDLNLNEIIENTALVSEYSEKIRNGYTLIVRGVVSQAWCKEAISYLSQIGRTSLPNYHAIVEGAPNHHRINREDHRAYVQGIFHQFSFFPWNQDLLDLFNTLESVFVLKNLMNELPSDAFMGTASEDGCIARLSFQFYPKGSGYLNFHRDPVDYHQLVIPIMVLTEKGVDFKEGGLRLRCTKRGFDFDADAMCEPGDIVFSNASIEHGVEKIDPDSKDAWMDFAGRWMLLFAVNKLADNDRISNAEDVEDSQ